MIEPVSPWVSIGLLLSVFAGALIALLVLDIAQGRAKKKAQEQTVHYSWHDMPVAIWRDADGHYAGTIPGWWEHYEALGYDASAAFTQLVESAMDWLRTEWAAGRDVPLPPRAILWQDYLLGPPTGVVSLGILEQMARSGKMK